MNRRLIIIPMLTMFVLSLALIPIVGAETRWVWGFLYEGMDLDIYTPYQGYAGDKIGVRVRVEAKEDLLDVYIHIWVKGSKNYGYASWVYDWYTLYDVDLSHGVVRDETYDITVPSDVDSGLIYGYTECRWKSYEGWFVGWVARSYVGSFNLAYLRNLLDERDYWKDQYNTLKSTYDNYVQTHSYTNTEYNDLKSKYDALTGESSSARSLSYVFIVTTIAFLATTAYFALRKPKVKPA